MSSQRLSFILDAGPLSVLCSFPRNGQPYLHVVLNYATLYIPEGVVTEVMSGSGRIASVASPLVRKKIIQVQESPAQPEILDMAYSKILGVGERHTIKLALATGLTPIFDDKDAFMIACRFGLRPLVFQDMLIKLVTEGSLPKSDATEIAKATTGQFPGVYLIHTLDSLK